MWSNIKLGVVCTKEEVYQIQIIQCPIFCNIRISKESLHLKNTTSSMSHERSIQRKEDILLKEYNSSKELFHCMHVNHEIEMYLG